MMTNWKPSSGPAAAVRRAEMLERARKYFSRSGVIAVDTPALSRYAGTDPNIDSLAVHSKNKQDFFLHTSPEFCMKRLLADGYPDIYSVCRVFRDGECGKHHLAEFTIVEWYRLGFDLKAIIGDTIGFIADCLNEPRLAGSAAQYDFAGAFREFAGIDIFSATLDQLASRCNADASLRSEIGAQRDTWLDLIVSTVIAPQFARDQLTVVRHYPASQAALARLCPDDARVADRFEVFFGDLELANGYIELTDAEEQKQRIDKELQTRHRENRRSYPHDETLIAALEAGLPDCAGVAIGVERLQMVFDKTDDIGDVVTFVNQAS
jgi:lysyl-tRNA synthetase class 2